MTTRTRHEKLIDKAVSAIHEVHEDTTVSVEQVLESLEWIEGELGGLIRSPQGDPWFIRYGDEGVYLFVENTSRARNVEERVARVFEERLGYPPRRVERLAWGKWRVGPVREEGNRGE